MAQDIILKNQVWDDVPAVDLPIDGGGMQRFTDVSNTTAVPSDVASGKIFYNSSGIQQTGTSSGGGANLQTKTATYTPTTSQQTDTVSPDTGYDGLSSVGVTVNAVPMASFYTGADGDFFTENNNRVFKVIPFTDLDSGEGDVAGFISDGTHQEGDPLVYSVVSATTIIPTESTQTVGGKNYMMEGTVTVNAIPSNYVGSGITRRDDDDMSGVVDDPYYVVSAQSGYYPSSAEFTLPLMTLPSAADSSFSGTRKANILPSTSQRYLNIPSGYNPTAQFYQIIGAELMPLNVTQNGTYDPATYDVFGFGTVTVDVPSGGASNFVTGTFTTGSSAGYTNISIPYTGSGYPIMCVVVIDGGAYHSGTTWYTSTQRYAIGQWTMTKSNMTASPSYATSGAQNQGVTTWVFKNSTSSSTSYSRSSAMNTNVYTTNNASNSGANTIKLHSGNVLSYYVNTSSYGLHPNMTYRYFIVYSE